MAARDDTQRRCLATRAAEPKFGLIRLVLDPQGTVTPDLAERLPGRGVWVSADQTAFTQVLQKGGFARGFKTAVNVPDDLIERLGVLLKKRVIDSIGVARKAGLAVCGYEKTRQMLQQGEVALLLEAIDGAEGGRKKLRPLAVAQEAQIIACLNAAELGLAFGRENVIHAALSVGGASDRMIRETQRLIGMQVGGT